jgi:lipopolysaccharide transport system ATP-binding protein
MSSDLVIQATNVGKVFRSYAKPHHRLAELLIPGRSHHLGRDFHALEAVDFEVYRGETVGIVGKNGSGKSTLLQILCGIMEPSTGSVSIRGRVAALLELGAGFNPEFTGRENVILYASVLGFSTAEIEKKLPDVIRFADIGHFIDEPVKHYSSGMFVRLAFAAAIHVDPDILVIDEALSVGDEAFQRKCFSRIEEIKRRGATILFVSHAASTVLQLCDRALVLYNGRRTYLGSPNSAIAIYQRLLYAAPDRIDTMLAQAYAWDRSGSEWVSDDVVNTVDEPECTGGAMECLEVADTLERFDAGLVSQSAFEFESHGVTIRQPCLRNASGEMVNVLRQGSHYWYEYEVEFARPAAHVHFGMLIKSVAGVELAGASSHRFDDSLAEVVAGTRTRVRFHWRCNLLPGVYFLNAGCVGVPEGGGGGEIFLHRVVDAYAFRVETSERPRRTAGFFDVLVEPFVALEPIDG